MSVLHRPDSMQETAETELNIHIPTKSIIHQPIDNSSLSYYNKSTTENYYL